MPLLIVDSMDTAAPWQAFAPDGVTPSTELSLAIEAPRPRPGAGAFTGRVSGTVKALNHTLRRSLAALNLSQFDELRFWVYSDRPADGTPGRAFFLEMRLASAAVTLVDPSNTWQRYLPVSQLGTWEPVRVSLIDLAASIRNAVTVLQLRCSDANTAFNCNIDDIVAVRDAMIGDVDLALLTSLDKLLVLNGTAVPAVLSPHVAHAKPYFEILQYDVVFSSDRTQSARARGDFTDHGYALRPATHAYELYYQITAVADDRASQSRMLEFALRALTPRGDLVVNGWPLPMEKVVVEPRDQLGGARTDRLPLFYRVSTRQDVGPRDLVPAAKAVVVDGDVRALP